MPDLAVGRIQGITTTDVSSYVAGDLFYKYTFDTDRNGRFDKTVYLGDTYAPYFIRKDFSNITANFNNNILLKEFYKEVLPIKTLINGL